MPVFEMPMEQLQQYQGSSPRPEDFDAYWEKALADCEATGLEYSMSPAEFSAPGLDCRDLWFEGTLGAKIHCMFVCPSHVEGKIPGVVRFHGYMDHSGEWFALIPYAYAGCAVIAMDCRGQGGLSGDAYQGAGPTIFGHIMRGVRDEDPQKLYYRDLYLDAAKSIRILMSMDFVDETRIGVTGNSQGGGITLAACSLVPEVKLCAPIFPFLSDFKRVMDMDLNKGAYDGFYWYFKKCDPTHKTEEQVFERLGYIDVQNHAPRIKAEVLWQLGMMDEQCPPSTQFAAYNKLTVPKRMIIYPDHIHEFIFYSNDEIFQFFQKL